MGTPLPDQPAMLLGAHTCPVTTVDGAGWLTLPESFVEQNRSFLLSRWRDKSLAAFPEREFGKLAERFVERSAHAKKTKIRNYLRLFYAQAECIQVTEDRLFAIPERLMTFAEIPNPALALGLIEMFQICDPANFHGILDGHIERESGPKELEDTYGQGAKQLMSLILSSYRNQIDYDGRPPTNDVEDTPVQSQPVFLCHASSNKRFARKLATDLTANGCTVWLDEWELSIGDSLNTRIQRAILEAGWFLVLLTPASVKSGWCTKELNSALELELQRNRVFVVPVLYRDCDLPVFLKDKMYADLRGHRYRKGLFSLLQRFKDHTG